MTIDTSIRATDIVMIFVVLVGPLIAVQVTEYLRNKQDERKRKIHIFRTLMATRTANLAYQHIEALNLVEVEFYSSDPKEVKIIDCWKLYLSHLTDVGYHQETWNNRRVELLTDLLYEMAGSLGYAYDKAQIKGGTYYPRGYGDAEAEIQETRKLWLDVLRGNRQLPTSVQVIDAKNTE